MSGVTIETVKHIARLARLSLTEEEHALFTRQLDEILRYAESIQALELTNVEPMSHAGASSLLRTGDQGAGLTRAAALENAPDAADGLFRVPRVIP
jgi:aspartyl-tRNA(Asn)/glutamyl-tRNA(Gln) amidotransferase subunit C